MIGPIGGQRGRSNKLKQTLKSQLKYYIDQQPTKKNDKQN